MGIDGFHKWIKTNYPEAYFNIFDTKKTIHHLYIDLNYLLHLCHYNANDETHLINKMGVVILDICAKAQPSLSLNLFCDGTAPFAKMVLQRERRCKNISVSDDIFKTSLNFTPGTEFIENIPQKLNKIIKIIENQFCIKVNIDTIKAGEAEIKIKQFLLKYYKINKNHTHLLCTNDADVVLILCADVSYSNTYILLYNDILSINLVLESHFKKYGTSQLSHLNYINNLDFVFLNAFLGNDYIPKINQLSPQKLWDSYKLNVDKYKCLVKLNKKNKFEIDKFEIDKDFLIAILNDCISKIGRNKIIKYNKHYDSNTYDNYFSGMIWTLNMYNRGECMNYNYICHNKKPVDILNLVLYFYGLDNINKFVEKVIEEKNEPIPSILCGILLLPEGAHELINNKYKKFMEDTDIKTIYEPNFKITVDFLKKVLIKFNTFI